MSLIRGIHATTLFRCGVPAFNQADILPVAAHNNLIQRAEALYMDIVREEMTAGR